MLDKLILTAMLIAFMCGTHYAAFEMGRKSECKRNGNYFSYDFGECIEKEKLNEFVKR